MACQSCGGRTRNSLLPIRKQSQQVTQTRTDGQKQTAEQKLRSLRKFTK